MHRNHHRNTRHHKHPAPGQTPATQQAILLSTSLHNAPEHCRTNQAGSGAATPYEASHTTSVGQTKYPAIRRTHPNQQQTPSAHAPNPHRIRAVLRIQRRTRTRFTTPKNNHHAPMGTASRHDQPTPRSRGQTSNADRGTFPMKVQQSKDGRCPYPPKDRRPLETWRLSDSNR